MEIRGAGRIATAAASKRYALSVQRPDDLNQKAAWLQTCSSRPDLQPSPLNAIRMVMKYEAVEIDDAGRP